MKQKLYMFCAGYPSKESAQKGIFTHRTALALQKHFEVEVIQLRAFNFKRPFVYKYEYEGVPVTQLSIPQIPHRDKGRLLAFNSRCLTWGLSLLLGNKKLKRASAIHSTMLIPSSMAVQPVAQRLRLPHIGQAIGDDINFYLPELVKIPAMKRRLMAIPQIQCNSNALRKTLLENLPEMENRSFVLYRGLNTEVFAPLEEPSERSGSLRVLYLGGMQTFNPAEYDTLNTKGGHVLMEAWSRISEKISSCVLTFGGPGSDHVKVVKWQKGLKHPESVNIIGVVQPSDVPKMLRSHDLVIIPSLFEGLPNLANEAMASGIPVLGSNTGGIPECVIDGESGLLFERANALDLVEKLEYLLANPDLRKKLGDTGRRKMVKELSWDRYAEMIKVKLTESK